MNDTLIRSIRACSAALEQLAAALEQQPVSRATPAASNSWPDIMTTNVAARYCGFKTTGGLRKARLEGRVTPAGRRGSRGSLTWAKAELDRFMCGSAPPASVAASDDANAKLKMEVNAKPPRPPTRARRMSMETEAALRRIKEIGKTKKP